MSGASDEDPPDDFSSELPPAGGANKESAKERMRSRLESVIPEILKRAVEIGVEKARESPGDVKQFIHDLKVPKEVAHYLLQQIDETKNGLFRVVAKEIRDFLEHTNFAGEIQKILTTVQFEVNTTIRFTPNDGRSKKKKRKAKAADERAPEESSTDAVGDTEDDDMDGEEAPESDRHPLPKPEVKTTLHKHRRP